MGRKRTDAEVVAAMHERLTYHPEVGELRRRDGFTGVNEGDRLGSPDTSGQLQTKFMGKRYFVSWLVWLWETGALPTDTITCVNGDNADNRFSNLVLLEQPATQRLNQQRFLVRARERFGDVHDYSDTRYVAAKEKVSIKCPNHGVFARLPADYLKSAKGCPACCSDHSIEMSRATPEQRAATAEGRAIRERARQKVWREANRAEYNAKFRKHYERTKGDPDIRAMRACRRLLARVIRQTKGRRKRHTEEILGYTFEAFKLHLEARFEAWMTWDNHGEWHVDHITPVSWYVRHGVTDPAVINRLDNLRPLSARENLRKHNKLLSDAPLTI